ncbi:MAG: glycosyltransferase family 2 protein [SAR324 cluster bacterium]|nr:glycosyltransferase family 2 protein [SAR324 cluster bacterium]
MILSIVIPAHNEERCIEETVINLARAFEEAKLDSEILIINDNSTDRTEEILKNLETRYEPVKYLNNRFPQGFGFAIRFGLENFSGDAVAIVMADSSESPQDVVMFFKKLEEGYDCIFGSRFIKGGKTHNYPVFKLLVNRFANLFISILFGVRYNDTTNAFKMYRRQTIEGLKPFLSHHFNLTVELPLKAISRGYSFAVLPNTYTNRTAGESKLKIKEMGSRYLFIVLYCLIEKWLSLGDYKKDKIQPDTDGDIK